jgi:hypothetical protein
MASAFKEMLVSSFITTSKMLIVAAERGRTHEVIPEFPEGTSSLASEKFEHPKHLSFPCQFE